MKHIIKSFWPYFALIIVTLIFFYPFFFKGLIPIPADILPGVYYPWHDISFPGLPAGVPVKNALPSDIVSLTYPLRFLAVNLLRAGEWPLWNPYILSGTPLLANFQSSVLNPLNLFFFLPVKFYLVWSFQVLLQPLMASLFLFWFLRNNKLSSLAALFGSVVWGFGGFVAIWAGYNTVIHAILTLPLILLALDKMGETRWAGVAVSFSVFYSIVAGNPPMTVILLLTSGLYAVWTYDNSWKKYLTALFYVLIGIALSAPLLLTGLEVMSTSIREVDTIAYSAGIKFLPIFKLITFVAPDFFGHPSTLNLWHQAGLYDNLTVYLGVVPVMLFVSSFFHFFLGEKRRLIHFFWFLFVFSLALAVKNPISVFIGNLPVLGFSAMVMTRFTVLTGLAVAGCSAIVVDEILSGRTKFVSWRSSFTLSVGVIVILLLFSKGMSLWTDSLLVTLAFGGHETLQELTKFANTAFRNSVIPIGLIFATFISISAVLLWPGRSYKKGNNIRLMLVIFLSALTFFEFFRFYQKYNTFSKLEYLYPSTPITDYLATQPGRFARETGEVIPSNMWLPYLLSSPSGYDTLHSLRYNQFLSLVNGRPLKETSSRYAEVRKYKNQFLDFLGVQNIVSVKRILGVPDEKGEAIADLETKHFPVVFEDKKVAVVSNPRAFPLVYSVDHYLVSDSIWESERYLKTSDLRRTVILEKDPHSTGLSVANLSDPDISSQSISLTSEATTSSFIVTSTTFDPGWHLYIDEEETEIFIANHAFIGFPLSPGTHNIKLYYRPAELSQGIIISGASLIILVLGLIYLPRWQKNLK